LIVTGFLCGLLDESPETFILTISLSPKNYGLINRYSPAGGIDTAEIGLA